MQRASLSLFFILALSLIGAPAHAQLGQPASMEIGLSPKYPRPNEQVTVTITSNAVNLAASSIKISVDGEVVSEGSRTALVRVGKAGTKTTITATVVNNGTTYSKSISVQPSEVSLVIEPGTTAHPFYEGARLVAPESRVRLVAIADMRTSGGTRISEAQLSYTWRLGEQILTSQSGLGKSVLEAVAPVRYRDAQVSVTVATQDGSQSAYASVYVSPVTPLVRIYRSDPLAGTNYFSALSDLYALLGSEDTFVAVPYFFKESPLLSWTLNGVQSSTESNITVRTTGTSAGTALLGVTASNANLESAQTRLTVQFGSSSKNIFGF